MSLSLTLGRWLHNNTNVLNATKSYTSVQFSSVAQSCPTLCNPKDYTTPGLPVHHQLPELAQTHVHQVGDAIQPSHPLPSPSPPAFIFTSIRGSSNESVLHIRIAKVLELQLQHSPSNEYSGLISFRMNWLDLLAVQGTLKSLLQHHSSKPSILWCSAFFIVQLSHPYMTTGKTIALTRWTFVGKVMSLLFNMLSKLVIAFLPRSKWLLISWLQSPSTVILEPKKIKSGLVSIVSPSVCHEGMGPDAMIFAFWMLRFKPAFSLSSFTFIKRLFSSSSLSAIRVVSSAYLYIREKNLPPQNISLACIFFPRQSENIEDSRSLFCLPLSCSKDLNKGLVFKIELWPEISAKHMG